jgi:signal transduction histidine kinase
MLLAIAAVFAAALWSSAIERRASLAEFSHEQAVLASAVAVDFEHRLERHLAGQPAGHNDSAILDDTVLSLLGGARRLEERGGVMVMVARPGHSGFLTTDRRMIPSSTLRNALDRGATDVTIPRDEAVTFGLPRRRAMAGLAPVTLGNSGGSWGVVVLASAERLRERERHEQWRFGLTALVVSALVLVFGGLALRRQRHELELERQVAVSSLEREREALLADADKMAALAALSTGIAHEVGTPLGVIVGRVEQVLDGPPNEERSKAALGIVLEQVARIQAIVRGCLALARGDAPLLARTAPATIAEQAVALVRHRFEKADVEIVDDVEDDLPQIACDPALFEQALVNVLLNACQASPGGGRVHLRVSRDQASVRFVVDDEGPGITDEVARRATQPFFSTKRDQGGSGLGLTIAREIVNHHGGTLSLSRRTDASSGTRATIVMPA